MAKNRRYTVSEPEEEPVDNTPVSPGADLQENEEKKRLKNQFYHWPKIIVFILGFLLYAQTVTYQYALDDKLVITHNYITKKGFAGIDDHFTTDFLVGFFGKQKNLLEGGRYRPISLVFFAIENQLFGEKIRDANGEPVKDKDGDEIYEYNPFVGHFMNTVTYALIGLLLFIILYQLFPPDKNKAWYFSFPFIASLLFVLHPLHTEAVANIKGRDELLSLLFSLAVLYFSIRYSKNKRPVELVWSALFFMAAILSKEAAVTFLAVVPMTLFYFTNDSWKKIFITTAPLLLILVIYLPIRMEILGGARTKPIPELMNMPFMHSGDTGRMPTVFYTLGLYLKLLFFPHPLTHDYYPWHPIGEYMAGTGQKYPYLTWANGRALIPFLIYMWLFIYAIRDFFRILNGKKEKNIISYSILFYLGTLFLVSNIPFQVGTFLNERFMFVPSIAFSLLVAHFFLNYLPKKIKSPERYKKVLTTSFIVIFICFSAKTITRNMSWENDFALSVGDVKVSYNSAKSNMSAGLALVDESKKYKTSDPAKQKQMLDQAVKHLARSLNIYTTYIQPMLIMGNAYYELAGYYDLQKDKQQTIANYNMAITYFEKCLKLNNTYEYSVKNLEHVGDLCVTKKLFDVAIKSYETLLSYDKTNEERLNNKLAQAYSSSNGNSPKAKKFLVNEITRLEKELQSNPQDISLMIKLGEYYGKNMGDLANSLKYLEMAYQLDPESSDVLQKLGVVYAMTGKPVQAIEIFEKALVKNPNNPHIIMNIGIAHKNLGQVEKGQEYLNRAFEIDPSLRQ